MLNLVCSVFLGQTCSYVMVGVYLIYMSSVPDGTDKQKQYYVKASHSNQSLHCNTFSSSILASALTMVC
jgi:hypothetical protein